MKLKFAFFFAFLMLTSVSFAQDVVFPVSGTYKFNDDVPREINRVVVSGNKISLNFNENVYEQYEIVSLIDNVYHVEQYFDDNVKRDKRWMNIEITAITENSCNVKVSKLMRSEVLNLIRID